MDVPDPGGPSAVTVVLVHRDRPDALADTIARFRAQTVPTRIVVVDNGSSPPPAHRPAGPGGPDEVIETGANLGFGPGANVGMRHWLRAAAGEWVAVAPHDADPDPDTLERILAAVADRPEVGLVSADVGDGRRPLVQPFLGSIDGPPLVAEGFEPADYPHGTLLMARRGCLEEVGLFDERYFAYCEEADLGLRAADAGWEVGVVRGAAVRNPRMSAPVPVVAYLQLRNTLLLLRERFGRSHAAFRATFALGQLVIGAVHPPARGLHWSPRGRVLAVRDHLLGRYGPPPASLVGPTGGAQNRPSSAAASRGRIRTR